MDRERDDSHGRHHSHYHRHHRTERRKASPDRRRSRSRSPRPQHNQLKGRGNKSSGLRAWDTALFPEAKVLQSSTAPDKPWVEVAMKELEDKGFTMSETVVSKPKIEFPNWTHDKFIIDKGSPAREGVVRASPTHE